MFSRGGRIDKRARFVVHERDAARREEAEGFPQEMEERHSRFSSQILITSRRNKLFNFHQINLKMRGWRSCHCISTHFATLEIRVVLRYLESHQQHKLL